jgi:hypothetical protein
MAVPLIEDACDFIGATLVMTDALTHITGMSNDEIGRWKSPGSALPGDVMSEDIAVSIVRRRQNAVSLRLRSAGPEAAIAINDQAIPDGRITPSAPAARVKVAVAATKLRLADLDLIREGQEVGAALLADARDGTLVGHRDHSSVSDPGCFQHAGVTSCIDFTTPDQIGRSR